MNGYPTTGDIGKCILARNFATYNFALLLAVIANIIVLSCITCTQELKFDNATRTHTDVLVIVRLYLIDVC